MTDLSVLIANLCDGLGSDPGAVFPAFPGSLPGKVDQQVIEDNDISRSFRSSRLADDGFAFENDIGIENIEFSDAAHARTSSCVLEPGKPGKPGNQEKSLAETDSLPFPVKLLEPGKPGNQEPVAGAFSSPGDPLPISPADVRAGVARELRALAEDGRERPDALRDAVAITAGKIRNAPALSERQVHAGQCHACGGPLDDTRPLVAVLNPGGPALHLHGGECHAAHSARKAALVGSIMTAAGYGAEAEGVAA